MKKLLTILFFLFILIGCNMTETQQEEVKNLQTTYDSAVKDTVADTVLVYPSYDTANAWTSLSKYGYLFYTNGEYVNIYVKDQRGFMKDSKGDSVEILQLSFNDNDSSVSSASMTFHNQETYKKDVVIPSILYTINCYNHRLPFADYFTNGVYRLTTSISKAKSIRFILLTLKPMKG